jgi:lambda repressor-like predicted transcriptional regulator
VYELAAEFACHRTTVAARLKKAGIVMRGQSPTPDAIDSMVRLYVSGLSLEEIGKQLGFCANTVRNCLLSCRILARVTHGQERQALAVLPERALSSEGDATFADDVLLRPIDPDR